MKKILLIIFPFWFLGCQQDINMVDNQDSSLVTTRATTTSPVFDWESIQKINIKGYGNNVVLPWYNGSSSQLPFYIVESYKKEDGWMMLYNFCTDQNETQKNRYYLMFYNIFTGIMRTYYFNPTGVTGGSTTLWTLSLDKPSSLLNTSGYFTEPISKIQNSPKIYTSNISTNAAKAITPAWNTFDVEFAYDSKLQTNMPNLHMSIGGYDVTTSNINLQGDISLSSEGTMITQSTQGSSSSPLQKAANSAISSVGKEAGQYVKKKVENSLPKLAASAITAIATGGTSEIAKFGVNLIFGSFLGRGSKPQVLNFNSDIKLTTNGTLAISGSVESVSSANLTGISNLLIPGATPFTSDRLQPAYNRSLGVWNLKDEPIVEYSDEKIYVAYSHSDNADWGDYSILRNFGLKKNSVNIILNPAVLENIERYTVDSEMVLYGKFQGSKGLDKVVNIDNEGYQTPKDIIPFFDDLTKGAETTIYRDVYLAYPTLSQYTYFYPEQRWNRPGDNRHIRVYATKGNRLPTDDVAIKVTVTLYPKAPYNTEPILSTRTYLPKFEKTYGTFDYMKSF